MQDKLIFHPNQYCIITITNHCPIHTCNTPLGGGLQSANNDNELLLKS